MTETLIVRGHYRNGAFHPSLPLPEVEGIAELHICVVKETSFSKPSIAVAFGTATELRSGEVLLAECAMDREASTG
ncbi:MAG: hypothetical protein ACRCZF_23025 [Gemmataceae bacterium]